MKHQVMQSSRQHTQQHLELAKIDISFEITVACVKGHIHSISQLGLSSKIFAN